MAQYNSKHTGAQIDSAVERALAGGAIDQAIAASQADGALPGVGFRFPGRRSPRHPRFRLTSPLSSTKSWLP